MPEGGSGSLHLEVRTAQPEHQVVQDCFSSHFESPFCLGGLDWVRMKT